MREPFQPQAVSGALRRRRPGRQCLERRRQPQRIFRFVRQQHFDEPKLGGAACTIDLDLGLGSGAAAYLASDLSYDYVRLNAEYTT